MARAAARAGSRYLRTAPGSDMAGRPSRDWPMRSRVWIPRPSGLANLALLVLLYGSLAAWRYERAPVEGTHTMKVGTEAGSWT